MKRSVSTNTTEQTERIQRWNRANRDGVATFAFIKALRGLGMAISRPMVDQQVAKVLANPDGDEVTYNVVARHCRTWLAEGGIL